MIYTVTFNPSLDYIVHMEQFAFGKVNRTQREEIFEGGKGINVSIVLKNLGMNSIALGFIAGFTGDEIERGVKCHGCVTDFIRVKNGFSRINVKMKSDEESEINGQGPKITDEDLNHLYQQLDQLKREDTLVLAGSIPNTLPADVYEKILNRIDGKGIHVVVDATKDLLRSVLKYHPFLIKPNHHELGELYHTTICTKDEVVPYARKLQEEGARNVLVSMAGEGAVLLDECGNIFMLNAPEGKVINSVGSGDSMVAGFLYGYQTFHNYQKALQYGIAAGSASAFTTRLATKKEIEKLL